MEIPGQVSVLESESGLRLDQFLVRRLPEFSRAHLQRAIEAAGIQVNDAPARASYRVSTGDRIGILELEVPREGPVPQELPLDVLFEDSQLVVVNKPAGMVVHPAKGHWEGTLASGLAHHFGSLSTTGGPARPGIVHRLDRDTSGVIVVAKTDPTHEALAAQFKARTVEKEYLAIVTGTPERDQDVVEQPIGDHPTQREKKAIRANHPSSRPATTFYEVVERFRGFAYVRAKPKTGRTHQIRLHLAHAGHPILCDRLYGGKTQATAKELGGAGDQVVLERQALHAHRIRLSHPTTSELVEFTAPLAEDIAAALQILRTAAN